MASTKSSLIQPLALLLLAANALWAAPVEFTSGPDWGTVMRANRDAFLSWRHALEESLPVQAGPWYNSIPFKAQGGFAQPFSPEEKIDLNEKDKDGKDVWAKREGCYDGMLLPMPGYGSHSTYLYRSLSAQCDASIPVLFGSSDGIAVWLNGTQLLSEDRLCPVSRAQYQAVLDLKAGENTLLVKIYNRTGASAFYFTWAPDPLDDLWRQTEAAFPQESHWFQNDMPRRDGAEWFLAKNGVERRLIESALSTTADHGQKLRDELNGLVAAQTSCDDPAWLECYLRACRLREGLQYISGVNCDALRRAIADLSSRFPETYPNGPEYLSELDQWQARVPGLLDALERGGAQAYEGACALEAFKRNVLLSHPLLDFDEILVVRRSEYMLGLPQNWQGNCAMASTGYDNEVAAYSIHDLARPRRAILSPENTEFVGDVDLHFNADRFLFSMPGSHNRWQIWEKDLKSGQLRQVTPGEEPDVDNYDACYLPDGRVIFASTRCFQGVPCVGGGNTVANLCIMDNDGANIRQLCFDQDHNWCPTVMNDGRILYSRWEYSDTPHYFSRLLFTMNPDGTDQMAFYGSNSYWPNSTFYARPIPGHPSQIAAIISGHHGVPRMGEFILFDVSKGRFEADGVLQRIPGYGQPVEPVIADQLVNPSWPKFLHPYPIDESFFLVSSQTDSQSDWSLYLVDRFDNRLLLYTEPGYALFEPVPLRKTPAPPVIPDKVNLARRDADVYVSDVYTGPGLEGVPRGTVKALRLYSFHYTYPQVGGHINVAVEGGWDVHRILGTVPVEADGSAYFRVPSNVPIALQPLDKDGRAIQLMRSWFSAMPGEVLSCTGCHEPHNGTPPARHTMALKRGPSELTPWYGPERGFSFPREVQPVLDTYCVQCHNENKPGLDFRPSDTKGWRGFTPAYLALHPYVRRPGPESDYHLLAPMEFHASTSSLVQMLEKGHHGVELNAEAWDRLVTWIDLNVPDHGTWTEHCDIPSNFHQRREEMLKRYALRDTDEEAIIEVPGLRSTLPDLFTPAPRPPQAPKVTAAGWPISGPPAPIREERVLDLGGGVSMRLVQVPDGTLVLGSQDGPQDERPQTPVHISQPFWVGATEVTLAQYQRFNPTHKNGFLDQHNKDHTRPGYAMDEPNLPVIRVSQQEAQAFCQWLSQQTGLHFDLPTEAEWEWACRAGADTPMAYGTRDDDFSTHANLADASLTLLAVAGIDPQPIDNPSPYDDFLPKDARYNDGCKLMGPVAQYAANAWGLYDMHGNVSEWTASPYRPYPYEPVQAGPEEQCVARGGSWSSRPKEATASYREAYRPWQKVHDVGFRVICRNAPAKVAKR